MLEATAASPTLDVCSGETCLSNLSVGTSPPSDWCADVRVAADISRTRAASGKRGEASSTGPAEAETNAADTSPDLKALGLLFSSLALFLAAVAEAGAGAEAGLQQARVKLPLQVVVVVVVVAVAKKKRLLLQM